jgi:hypothetical protein
VTAGGDSEDNGERYTAVFTGLLELKKPGEYPYLRVGDDGHSAGMRTGRPPYSRLGREVAFDDLPESARGEILRLYQDMWDL